MPFTSHKRQEERACAFCCDQSMHSTHIFLRALAMSVSPHLLQLRCIKWSTESRHDDLRPCWRLVKEVKKGGCSHRPSAALTWHVCNAQQACSRLILNCAHNGLHQQARIEAQQLLSSCFNLPGSFSQKIGPMKSCCELRLHMTFHHSYRNFGEA